MNKVSRVALLSVLFSAPMFSMGNAANQVGTAATNLVKATENLVDTTAGTALNDAANAINPTKTYFESAKDLVVFPFGFLLATAPDAIAGYTVKPVLDYIASIKYFNYACFTGNTKNISRAIVLMAAAYVGYQAYMMSSAEETVDADEDDFVYSDNN